MLSHRQAVLGLMALVAILLFSATLSVASNSGVWLPNVEWSPVMRGKGAYKFALPERLRERALYNMGSSERLRTKLDQLKKGKPIRITTVGGSITAGQGAVDTPNWPQQLFHYLQDNYGQDLVLRANGAMAGTTSGFMTVCYNMHVPNDTDIVLVEYSVNDMPSHTGPPFHHEIRRGFERLIRKMLAYPNKPAVVLVHSYAWWWHPKGAFWSNAEQELNEFALYYGMPALSIKACCWHLMDADKDGFSVTDTRNNHQSLKHKYFYYDRIHPDGNTGARVTAELAMHMFDKVIKSLDSKPLTQEERLIAEGGIPTPMIPHNYESKGDRCFVGNAFANTVLGTEGFQWMNDAPNGQVKWGYIGTQPGNTLTVKVNTATQGSDRSKEVVVELAHLRSYTHMGKAKVSCVSGCVCQESVFDGNTTEKASLMNLHKFKTTQHEECTIKVTVVPETSSGEHKVKVTGIMVSEEGEGIINWAAIQMVHERTTDLKEATFNIA